MVVIEFPLYILEVLQILILILDLIKMHLSIPFTNIYISNDSAIAIPIPDKKDTNTENTETKTTFLPIH